MSILERCPSYKESTKRGKERQGTTLGVRFSRVFVLTSNHAPPPPPPPGCSTGDLQFFFSVLSGLFPTPGHAEGDNSLPRAPDRSHLHLFRYIFLKVISEQYQTRCFHNFYKRFLEFIVTGIIHSIMQLKHEQ